MRIERLEPGDRLVVIPDTTDPATLATLAGALERGECGVLVLDIPGTVYVIPAAATSEVP